MPVIDTSQLTNSRRTQYDDMYQTQVFAERVYDMFASPVGDDMSRFISGSQITFPYVGKMDIGTQTVSESQDVTPQLLVDASTSITPTSRGEAIQQTQLMRIQNYAGNSDSEIMEVVSENAAESIDWVAANAALQGQLVIRNAARASLDAGTAADRFTEDQFAKAEAILVEMKNPQFVDAEGNGGYGALVPLDAYFDLRTGGNVVSIAQYQQASIILNHELGEIGGFRISRPPWSHVFGSAGADNGSNAATTLSAGTAKLAKTIIVASATNIDSGRYLTIGTEETGDTHYEGNERVRVSSVSGTTVTIVGQGSNGGMRYTHASGTAVRNGDSVYPVVFGGPKSLVKWWDPLTGEYGELVMDEQGLLKQWDSVGWKWFGAYAIKEQKAILRGEYASSLDA